MLSASAKESCATCARTEAASAPRGGTSSEVSTGSPQRKRSRSVGRTTPPRAAAACARRRTGRGRRRGGGSRCRGGSSSGGCRRRRAARARAGLLEPELVGLLAGRRRARDPLDRRGGHRDARHLLVHEAEGALAADEADRRQERAARGHAERAAGLQERLELIGAVRDLELQEACAGCGLLRCAQRADGRAAGRRGSRPRRGRGRAPGRADDRTASCRVAATRRSRRAADHPRRRRGAPRARRRR